MFETTTSGRASGSTVVVVSGGSVVVVVVVVVLVVVAPVVDDEDGEVDLVVVDSVPLPEHDERRAPAITRTPSRRNASERIPTMFSIVP
jgi:hypothetical protein